mmetsp:Transcript_56414/g.120030  ORF Transcript_56414/g.120030 Transcript_56414/m.120030 type:complete len:216 (-) Transcript_56414:162-809(-)|eukprot:CAMPEP_0206470066 /NCGR_PEP_ID=MMETSP0324_2-20121206/30690_1 /ASSEMBLY_ACC=CAM_ASM_000836 /TAXON_ID=2866 /ORGANISM="Crypthecodinium cohnii, Strain Seligo" /LENGTH=215 /DNA_ID=CAMNT_0053944017 /DNA_START=126 /DNA_END=773 /DNA_ORIENTATION=-
MAGIQDLKHKVEHWKHAMQQAEQSIKERQKFLKAELERVDKERFQLGEERAGIEAERKHIAREQASLDQEQRQLDELRSDLERGGRKGGCCCAPRTERLIEQNIAFASVDAVPGVFVLGGGTMHVNGQYRKVMEAKGQYMGFKKEIDGMSLYWQNGAKMGTPNGWFIADSFKGPPMYWVEHDDPTTIPFDNWKVFDDPEVGHPGNQPAPSIEVAD